MATFTKTGLTWRAQIYVGGVRDSGTFPTKAKAQAWAAQRETELRVQKSTGILAGKTCRDAFERYDRDVSPEKRGHRWESLRLKALADATIGKVKFGDIKLTDLTPDLIGQWRDDRLKTLRGSTVNRDLNLLSHVLSTARKEWGWIVHSPTKDVRRPKDPAPRDRRIRPGEIEQLCLALGLTDGEMVETKYQRVAVAWLFAIETAMRAGEICALMPGDVKGAVAHLPRTKNGTKRDVPLSTRALQLLKLLPEGDGPLFGLSADSLSTMFRKARERCLITDMTFHDSRHEAITRLSKKLDVLDLARMTGHRDLKMLLIYYNASAADIAPRLD